MSRLPSSWTAAGERRNNADAELNCGGREDDEECDDNLKLINMHYAMYLGLPAPRGRSQESAEPNVRWSMQHIFFYTPPLAMP